MSKIPKLKLFGTKQCHKTQYYSQLLDQTKLPWLFLDVKENEADANELRSLYENGKLNFPTITIGTKKLRNPSEEELFKWLHKLVPQIENK